MSIRYLTSAAACAALLLLSAGAAHAQREIPKAKADTAGEDVSGKYKPGGFAAVDVGLGLTVGGEKGNSNAQPFLSAEGGYGIDMGSGLLSLSALYAIVSSDNNAAKKRTVATGFTNKCPVEKGHDALSPAPLPDDCPNTENYSLHFLNATVKYSHMVWQQRLGVFGRLGGGLAFGSPKPTIGSKNPMFDAQLGLGIDYFTRIPNLAVGAEFGMFYVVPVGIPAVTVFPTIKYTF